MQCFAQCGHGGWNENPTDTPGKNATGLYREPRASVNYPLRVGNGLLCHSDRSEESRSLLPHAITQIPHSVRDDKRSNIAHYARLTKRVRVTLMPFCHLMSRGTHEFLRSHSM